MSLEEIMIQLNQLETNLQDLVGVNNENFLYLEEKYGVEIRYRDNTLLIKGEHNGEKVKSVIELMDKSMKQYGRLSKNDLPHLVASVNSNREERYLEMMSDVLTRTFSGKPIKARTFGQKMLIDEIKNHDLCFAIGPAGTGKTFLAVAYAVDLLKKNEISKIILTRPAVEAGENLGFLPGDLKEKVDPYLRPLYDALDDLLSQERTERYIEKGIIEIAPLAYMRGRTLDNAVVILDEAQNTTKSQMMMFLSRLGENSKMIVNGDIQQIDLPYNQESGLVIAKRYLKDIKEISFVQLSTSDIVRHPLVSKILKGFEKGAIEDEKNSNNRR
ncbi:PhoH family protein [Erysipelothrix urinaevulpis]|uniref:PhoH family protein n=1 Tax=Erysipelothrix urinaevulpis TaxID=2683717 RepID=UPI001359EF52|nr:PhoH family protein [Erysipelothrix urinaevulpis]